MKGKEYFVTYPDDKRNHAGAKQFCNRIGGKLFEPYTTPQLNDDILIPARIKNTHWFWIGMNDRKKERSFVYESNGQRVCRENWLQGEPNNDGSGEDCVEMCYGTCYPRAGQWNDRSCYEEKPFGCERAST